MLSSDILIITALLALTLLGLGLLLGGLSMTLRALRGQQQGLPQAWQSLESQRRIERMVYRHHRISGLLIIAAAVLFFWQFLVHAPLGMHTRNGSWLLLSWLLAVGNGFNALIGVVILLRPSLLKPIETRANRWIAIDIQELGQRLGRHSCLRGLLLVLVALTLMSGTLLLLGERLYS